MTSHPIPDNHRHWWLCTGKWRVLHAIPSATASVDQMRAAIDNGQPVQAASACTLSRGWEMPGIASRLTLPRCAHCCRALGIPPGDGTPANENHRTEAS